MRFYPPPRTLSYIIYRYQFSLCEGSTIELLADIESEAIITISKNITIDGNGKTINSTAARAINIATEGEVTIKNLIVVATGERAVNVITYPATVKLEGVNLTASNYTVNVATSAGAAKVDIQKSTLRGLNTVNINGAGAEVTIDGCEIYCDDNNTTEGEDYAALCLGRDAVGGSIAATNSNIYITEGSDSTKGCNNADGGTITIDGATDGVEVKYAAIIYGDYYYAFNTVDEAIEYDATKTIILLRDATIGTEGTYTIDVNDHELSAAENFILTDNLDGTYTVVAAKAKIGTTLYATLAEAITAAHGATVTLLADATVSQACQIDKNNKKLTVNGNFVALKNYKNANGYYDVVAATKHAEFKLRGDFNYWGWDGAKDLYIITGTNLWVAPEVELTANETFKFANESWGNAWGAENDNANPANMWFSAGQNNLKVKTAGTYNVYYDFKVGVYRLDLMGAQFVAAEKVTYYLRANGSTNWDQGGAWFVAHFWNDANETYDVKLTAVPGKTGYYSTTTVFKGNYTKVIFIRMSKGATNMNNMWTKVDGEKDGFWNKTGNVTLPTDTRNLFTPSGWDNATTTWGTYQ